jgi:TonB family protein
MAVGTQTQGWDQRSRRQGVRHALEAPLDITVLRSGIPDTLPGRSINLGEGGLAAILAGELLPGEMVAVEFQLPPAGPALRARALVRHHDNLCSGMEFVGLSAELRAAIRKWVRDEKATGEPESPSPVPSEPEKESADNSSKSLPPHHPSGGVWISILSILVAVLMAIGWWHWNRGWQALESGLKHSAPAPIHPQAQVAADVMQRLLIHRVEPEYPAAARARNLQGVIVLDVIVGRDGSVVDLHAKNGPDILAQAARDALRWWRFQPYRVDGQAVVVQTTVAVEFKP